MNAILLHLETTAGSQPANGLRLVVLADSDARETLVFDSWRVPRGLPFAEAAGAGLTVEIDLRELINVAVYCETENVGSKKLMVLTLDEFSMPIPGIAYRKRSDGPTH
jgi:hypothetical protein